MKKFTFLFFLLLFASFPSLLAQSISGFVLGENNEAIPYVNVFVRELASGTSTDESGRYYLQMDPGNYQIVFSAIGYEEYQIEIVLGDDDLNKTIYLKPSNVELEELVVKASKKDPAYGIIRKAIENKEKYLTQLNSSKTEVYVKATEEINDLKSKYQKKDKDKQEIESTESIANTLPTEQFLNEVEDTTLELNMVEMQLTLNFQAPDSYKEERTAYKKYGSKHGLFLPLFNETDFNFYRNLVQLKGIVDVPVISPISKTAILTYKYKLVETLSENENLVYKIKVTPRKVGNASVNGFIYINEGTWNINRLELSFYKGALTFYDAFTIKQNYEEVEENLWIPYRQEFVYKNKQGRSKTFKGNTLLLYSNFQKDYEFPEKFFGNEIAVTTKEAYKKDSTFWNQARPEPLTIEEQEMVRVKDSLETLHNSEEYQDSIQEDYNKIEFIEVVWQGLGFRDWNKKSEKFIGPIPSLINFDIITGWGIGPILGYGRRFENGQYLSLFGRPSISLEQQLFQIDADGRFRYDPHRLADININLTRASESINSYDAITNVLNPNNYIMHENIGLGHRFEIINGLYLETAADFHNRKSIEEYKVPTFLDEWFGEDTTPLEFDTYQAFITDIKLSYTPFQRYLTEPTRKVVLGSKFPTFSLTYEKGWNGLLTSDIDYDYLEFEIKQNLVLGIFGSSNYTIQTGKFINTKDLRFVDSKWFRQSDPWLFSNPLQSFQLLPQTLETKDIFVEMHYVHHFNGALVNTLPLIKKTRIRAVAGACLLWMKAENFRQEELFLGVERIFKLGPRRRLRVGIFGIVGESNAGHLRPEYKFSLDIIDTWKKDWSY